MEIIEENVELDITNGIESLESPLGRRTSNYFDFDHNFDSISTAFSESTIADSEFVAQRIMKFENDRNQADKRSSNKQSNVYNLSIDKVVINGAKGETEIEKPVKDAVDKIVADLNRSPEKYGAPRVEKQKSIFTRPKLFMPVLIFLAVVIGVSITVSLILSQANDKNEDIETTSMSTTTTLSYQTGPETTTTRLTTPTTPVPDLVEEIKLVKRSAWISKGLNVEGKYKQMKPVKKIIVLYITTDDCYDEASCIDFVAENQLNAYPEFDDVRENFFVGLDGTVYEGRGFSIEGQTTFASQTSYNNKAVSISFIKRVNGTTPYLKQQESFCRFINHSIEQKDLTETFSLFHHSHLVSTTIEADDDFVIETCNLQAHKPPSIIRRRDWNASDFSTDDNFHFRTFSRNVIVGSSKGQSCVTREACSELLLEWQKLGEIEYNFVFTENNIILEGTSFDVVVQPEFFDSLRILYLGNFQLENGEELINGINRFLLFAVEIGKLSENYKIRVDCQESTSSDLLEVLRNDSHFDKDFQCE